MAETDFYLWTKQTASALRYGHYHEVNMMAVAEEIEAMGARERRELMNRFAILIMHLLEWHFQPGLRSRSWQLTIIEQRREIQDLLEDSPSLEPELDAKIGKAYGKAMLKAERETNLSSATFPTTCPYPLQQLLDENFFPE